MSANPSQVFALDEESKQKVNKKFTRDTQSGILNSITAKVSFRQTGKNIDIPCAWTKMERAPEIKILSFL